MHDCLGLLLARLPSFDFAQGRLRWTAEAAVSPCSRTIYGFGSATFRAHGPLLGSNVQNGLTSFVRLGKSTGTGSLPPLLVLTSWSIPSLPAMTIVPPSAVMSAAIGVALFCSWIPPKTDPVMKL